MYLLQAFFTISIVFSGILANEVCDPKVGCFNNSYPWTSDTRNACLPYPPEHVCKQVFFYSERLKNIRFTVYPEIDKALFDNFNEEIPTYFIAHGFVRNGTDPILHQIAELFLKHEPANIYIIGKMIFFILVLLFWAIFSRLNW